MDMLNPCIESMHDCNQVVVEMSELWEWNLIVSHSCDRPKPTGTNFVIPTVRHRSRPTYRNQKIHVVLHLKPWVDQLT